MKIEKRATIVVAFKKETENFFRYDLKEGNLRGQIYVPKDMRLAELLIKFNPRGKK